MNKYIAFGISALLCACAGAPSQRIIEIDGATDAVECSIGDAVEVSLESNPTTGYGWVVENPQTRQTILEQRCTKPPKSGLVGAPGKEVFVFRCVNEGETLIKMAYKRPWEDAVAKRFKVKVAVKKQKKD